MAYLVYTKTTHKIFLKLWTMRQYQGAQNTQLLVTELNALLIIMFSWIIKDEQNLKDEDDLEKEYNLKSKEDVKIKDSPKNEDNVKKEGSLEMKTHTAPPLRPSVVLVRKG